MRWTQTFIPVEGNARRGESPAEAALPPGSCTKLPAACPPFLTDGPAPLRRWSNSCAKMGPRRRSGVARTCNREIWEKSSRYVTASDVLLRRGSFQEGMDPQSDYMKVSHAGSPGEIFLPPTAEEFLVQTKFRDEIRPRKLGLMRAKFIMKDAYSFDTTDELAQVSYQKMLRRLRARRWRAASSTMAVEADTGVMAGKFARSGKRKLARTKWPTAKTPLRRQRGRPSARRHPHRRARAAAASGKVCRGDDHRRDKAAQRARRPPNPDAGCR